MDALTEELSKMSEQSLALVHEITDGLPQDKPTVIIAMAFGFLFADALQQFRRQTGAADPELTERLVNAIIHSAVQHVFDGDPKVALQ